ncbi:MAG: ATP-binding protein [Chthoniobacterales bacterium]
MGNLLNNAIKFTAQDGRVDVIVERFGNQALIKMKDAGIGIKPDFLPRIFDRFTQVDTSSSRKYSGLGLGLAIVKSLVEMHQGSVSAESEGEGKGAQFTISLPLTDAKKRKPRVFSYGLTFGSLPAPLAGIKILIVDDDADARKVIEHALRHAGAQPSIAQSGQEALELIRETQFEVLISDIAMPEMDGHQLLRRMRDSSFVSKNLHTIALTAYARQEDRKRAFEAGFEQVLAKPVDMDELVGSVAHIMGAHHHEII